MGHTSKNMEDSGVEWDLMNFWGVLAQAVTAEKRFSMLLGDFCCDILVKKVTDFCLGTVPLATN